MSPVRTAPANLTAAEGKLRAKYLSEVMALLYPGETEEGEFIVIPHARSPRLLVPAASRRVAAAAVRRYAEPQSRLARFKRDAVVAALLSGAGHVLLRDRVRFPAGPDTIETYLRTAIDPDLLVSVHIGPARANRKPILQLLNAAGQTIGFAKLGPGPLTRRLVRAETTALTALGHVPLHNVTVPRVVHTGSWRGIEILVQSVLPIWRPRAPLGPGRLDAAMREVAEACGVNSGQLRTSPYWATLRGRLDELGTTPEGRTLATSAHDLITAVGETVVPYGAWHGDWSPWNMAVLADTILLWDWERFATDVPIGFDALHYALQRELQAGGFGARGSGDAAAAVDSTVDKAAQLLAPMGVTSPEAAHITALLYLIDLATRYLDDRQAEAGARLGVLGTWLLPVLVRRVADAIGGAR